MVARLRHKAATLHSLLLVGAVVALSATGAGAQTAALFSPNCDFREVSLAPCTMMAAGGNNNISGACCSSLNRALDAGHRCVCSLLLANYAVFASLVANLLTLPLVLPLPGCFLYAPSLAACCQATTATQQQTNAPPPTATSAVASTGTAAVAPTEKKSAGPEKADGGGGRRSAHPGNGTSEAAAAPRAGSSACGQRPGQGTAYALAFLTAVAASLISVA